MYLLCLCCSSLQQCAISAFFFFNDTATTEIYTLSLHDALPISRQRPPPVDGGRSLRGVRPVPPSVFGTTSPTSRSEEHTSELQSQFHLVCRLLLEKKKQTQRTPISALYVFVQSLPRHRYTSFQL